ncbi:MAG: alpha/beta family hydrolase [Candidatus Margulisiibacteriota bacterium]
MRRQLSVRFLSDGSVIQHLGALENPKLVVILGREDVERDNGVFGLLYQPLLDEGYTLIWYEFYSRYLAARLADPFGDLSPKPAWIRRVLGGVRLLAYRSFWGKLWKSRSVPWPSFEDRYDSVRQFFATFPGGQSSLVVLSRSSGGVVASTLAESVGIHRIVCAGYPFKHPQKPEEVYRTQHLETLKTPFLIFQGRSDAYGGEAAVDRYALSDNIQVQWVESDHDFGLKAEDQAQFIAQSLRFLGFG